MTGLAAHLTVAGEFAPDPMRLLQLQTEARRAQEVASWLRHEECELRASFLIETPKDMRQLFDDAKFLLLLNQMATYLEDFEAAAREVLATHMPRALDTPPDVPA